ncbi:hypothetical protein ElyMa_003429000 [Elysia marginata]|uniref:Uncharacterized protein n=1 Tax=Elysia marginata TaxID=1093978 RepID=A0AAV4JRL6_9GAST|nr:hypothetical protein ElyMa_003429000 [Elysia marginata]
MWVLEEEEQKEEGAHRVRGHEAMKVDKTRDNDFCRVFPMRKSSGAETLDSCRIFKPSVKSHKEGHNTKIFTEIKRKRNTVICYQRELDQSESLNEEYPGHVWDEKQVALNELENNNLKETKETKFLANLVTSGTCVTCQQEFPGSCCFRSSVSVYQRAACLPSHRNNGCGLVTCSLPVIADEDEETVD